MIDAILNAISSWHLSATEECRYLNQDIHSLLDSLLKSNRGTSLRSVNPPLYQEVGGEEEKVSRRMQLGLNIHVGKTGGGNLERALVLGPVAALSTRDALC